MTAAQTRDVYYTYDLRNLQLSARFDSASGEGVTNAYDGFGRLASSSIDMGGVTRTLSYQYDPDGHRTRIVHPDGVYFNTRYDGLGRSDYLYHSVSTGIVARYYNDIGALSIVGHGGISFLGYDGVQRLSSTDHRFTGGGTGATAVYWSYAYNPAGQLGTVTRDGDAFAWTGHYAVNRGYTTNGLNQYSAAGTATFGYDANGNLVSDGSSAFVYDIENRLVSASGARNATLAYDPLGRLWQLGSGANATRFLYDGDALVAEYDGSGALTHRYAHWDGADTPAVAYDGAGLTEPYHLFADRQGSIVALVNAAGAATAIDTYDEYGIPGAANQGRFQYTGQAWLAELGMYYYKARIYSPTLGRFMQTDPVGYQGGNNIYAYVGDDPLNDTDPTGLMPPEEERAERLLEEPSIPETADNVRAMNALNVIRRMDSRFQEPPQIRNPGSSLRTREEGDYFIGAHAARRMTGYYNTCPTTQTPEGAQFGRVMSASTFQRTTMNVGSQTYQFTNGSSGTAAFRSIVGNNFRTMNGTMVANNINMGGGVRGDFNLHVGRSAGRTGGVLEGRFSSTVTGSHIANTFRAKIEFTQP